MRIIINSLEKERGEIKDLRCWRFYLVRSIATAVKYVIFVPFSGDILFYNESYGVTHLDKARTLQQHDIIEDITDKINIEISY